MNLNEIYSIREWAPLTDILEKIPSRIQKGIFQVDLSITCIDAVAEYIVLGSNFGIVFWCSRYNGEVQKLKIETSTRVTAVKVVSSVEYMVAAGDDCGRVTVFQIQKKLPADLNLVAPCARVRPIERYTIRDLHHCAITCCEWSKNGMKLFSGDRQGVVVLTEFDFPNHLSKSAVILSEAYEIVQLSVQQKFLLVSTIYRSIICQPSNQSSPFGDWQITQVGKKDRKQLVGCGGIFLRRSAVKKPLLLCCRPGLRFWLADTAGNVEKTLLFREALSRSPTWEIPILNPRTTRKATTNNGDGPDFGRLVLYDCLDTIVLTHDDDAKLYILNLTHLRVEAVATGFRKILDMCVCGNEIFVLEGERSLLRLASMPEKPSKKAKIIFNPSMPPPLPLLGNQYSSSICESPVEHELVEDAAIINAEECFEQAFAEEINLNIPIELAIESPRSEQNRRLEIFQQISDMDFDHSILHHSDVDANGRKKRSKAKSQDRKNTAKFEGIVEIAKAAVKESETEARKPYINQATSMDISICNETNSPCKTSRFTDHILQELSTNKLSTEGADINETTTKDSIHSPQIALSKQTQLQLQLPLMHSQQQTTKVEDAGVQTTPRNKTSLPDECDDDSIVQILHPFSFQSEDHSRDLECGAHKFLPTQPVDENIVDAFDHPNGSMGRSPPISGNSNNSGEWEFLDN